MNGKQNCRRAQAGVMATLLWVAATAAQEVPDPLLIQHPGARPGQSLDGDWQVIVDPYENGYYNHRYEPRADGYFQDRRPAGPADLVEYSFDASPSLAVPGDWNSQDPKLFWYEGTLWYRRQFEATPAAGGRQFLHFGAANYTAEAWLNGAPAGRHEGGFTPFDLEVTGLLREGTNTLVVKVDNRRLRDGVPTLNTDWWNYGGLTRSVRLLELPRAFIRDWFLQLDPADPRRVAGWVRLDGAPAGQVVTLDLPGAGISERATADADGYARFAFAAPEGRWSPGAPTLHAVRIAAGADAVEDRIGLRQLAVRGGDILLNGEPVFLRGISIHAERPGGGRAFSREHARQLLGWAQELGANFVRLAHYPHDESMLRLADELGLMVWAEVPVYWTVLFEDPAVLGKARAQLAEMVVRDRNRASVVLWSVANETPVSEARTAFLGELVATTRKLDPTRLLTAALDTQLSEGDTRVIADPLGALVDVIGVNSYCGWYSGTPESCAGLRWRSDFGKPVIMSEFGAGALAGLHGEAGTRWTEEYQAAVYVNNISMMREMPFLRGVSPWILMDFRSPRRPLPGIQDGWNRKGLVSGEGRQKLAFGVLRDWYAELAAQPAAD